MAEDVGKTLSLLNGLELKFALAESNESFQKLVDLFMVPIIRKLDSKSPSIVDKVKRGLPSSPILVRVFH